MHLSLQRKFVFYCLTALAAMLATLSFTQTVYGWADPANPGGQNNYLEITGDNTNCSGEFNYRTNLLPEEVDIIYCETTVTGTTANQETVLFNFDQQRDINQTPLHVFERNGGIPQESSVKSQFILLNYTDFTNDNPRAVVCSFTTANPSQSNFNRCLNGGPSSYVAESIGGSEIYLNVFDSATDTDPETPGEEAGDNNRVSCEGGSGFSLSWVFCPMIEGIASTVDFAANSLVGPFLEVEPLQTETEDGEVDPIYAVWSGFRNVANVVLVVVFLIIIFGQALSFGIDAYSVKKALPRLVLAAIAIQLSYFVSTVMVDLFNVIGIGIGDLILDAATTATVPGGEGGEAVDITVDGDLSQVFAGFSVATLFAIGGGIWVAASGAFAAVMSLALFVLLPVALAVLATFFVLIIRQGVIILLIVLAPVAMTMMVLPNTEQWFKRWADLFAKTLLMFPMIMALFAGSKLFASVLTARLPTSLPDSGADNTLYILTVFAALIALAAPLFLVPATFKFAGGAMAAIGGFAANMRSRGTTGIQGDARDPRSLRGALKRRRRHNIDRSMTGARIRFGGGETGKTRTSMIPGRDKEVKTLGSHANTIMNYAAGRMSDVEGRNATNIEEANKAATSLIQTGQDDTLFALALGNDREALEAFGKGSMIDDDGNFTDPQVAGSVQRMQSDPYMKREAAAYVATKIANTERGDQQLETLRQRVQSFDGLSQSEKVGTWGNATHGIRGSNLVARRTKLDGSVDTSAFLQDAAQMSSYHMNQQGPQFWDELNRTQSKIDLIEDSEDREYAQRNFNHIQGVVASDVARSSGRGRAIIPGGDPSDEDHEQIVAGGMGSPAAETAKQQFIDQSGISDRLRAAQQSRKQQSARNQPSSSPPTSGQVIQPNQNDPNSRVDSSDLPE